ncbi:MAG: anhydro-N-acetylmuramic acid kinase, partial [SAR324 cluster bacterium]|nr:anhydro-N-acetylmuramic acid kinase [SAR324 cluster bacterium]
PVNLIALHGQTIYHSPPLSWQLINPTLIAQKLNVPVIFDLRAADLAQGGQGAPITPLGDFILFRDIVEKRSIVNLGGFCNITTLPGISNSAKNDVDLEYWQSLVGGFDLSPCNHLLDKISRDLIGQPYDENGNNALTGSVSKKPFEKLHSILSGMFNEKRSLGTGDETSQWISRFSGDVIAVDLARTACAAIAQMIVDSVDSDRIILAGGGVKNAALMEEITKRFSGKVSTSNEFGIPSEHREAIEMAILGALCQDRVPITLPQVTGSKTKFISGCWVLP